MSLALTHARYLIIENLRVPISVIGSGLFPSLSLLFFVVPFGYDSAVATTSIASLAVFAVMSSCLFTYGVGVAEDRELAWDPYVRTLPVDAGPRIAGRLINGAMFVLIGLVPLLLLGAFATSATANPAHLLAGLVALLVAGLPFLFGGLAIGYSLTVKAALPVAQLILFPMAFAGGLFLPPYLFPPWLDTVSMLLPSRGARDLVVWAVVGDSPDVLALVVFAVWTVGAAALAVWAYRRDEGRRFR